MASDYAELTPTTAASETVTVRDMMAYRH